MPRTSRLSIELLQTFLCLLDHDGDTMAAASELGINQPSMSKRLAFLQYSGRGITRPWLKREGKTWAATAEGLRVLPAVRDILARYDRLTAFTEEVGAGLPAFTFGCGQQAATGLVLRAARRFHLESPDIPYRIAQMRGRARIEGVANGALDLAAVTDREETILSIARRELHIDTLPEEPLVLVAARQAPGAGPMPAWHAVFTKLPPRGVPAEALRSFPLIVPEPDADVRRSPRRGGATGRHPEPTGGGPGDGRLAGNPGLCTRGHGRRRGDADGGGSGAGRLGGPSAQPPGVSADPIAANLPNAPVRAGRTRSVTPSRTLPRIAAGGGAKPGGDQAREVTADPTAAAGGRGISNSLDQGEVALPKFSRPKYQYWNSLARESSTRAAVCRSHSRRCAALASPAIRAACSRSICSSASTIRV